MTVWPVASRPTELMEEIVDCRGPVGRLVPIVAAPENAVGILGGLDSVELIGIGVDEAAPAGARNDVEVIVYACGCAAIWGSNRPGLLPELVRRLVLRVLL